MRKSFKIALSILSLFFSTTVVQAEIACEDFTLTAVEDVFETKTGYVYNYDVYGLKTNNYNYDTSGEITKYILTDTTTGKEYVSYCRNAGWCATEDTKTDINGVSSCVEPIVRDHIFKCIDKLMDSSVDDTTVTGKEKKAYDSGIVYLAVNGYNTDNPSNHENYVKTNMAMRVYELIWAKMDTNSHISIINVQNQNGRSMKSYAHKLLMDSSIKNIQKEIESLIGDSNVFLESEYYEEMYKYPNRITSWEYNGKELDYGNWQEGALYNYIKDKVLEALTAAKNYLENGTASINWDEKPSVTKKPTVKNGGTYNYETKHTYNFEIKSFNSNSSRVNLDFTCENCEKYGIDYEIFINNSSTGYTDLSGINFAKNYGENVKLDIVFKASSDSYSCEKINYDIDVLYADDSLNINVYSMRDANCNTCQKFYVLDTEPDNDGKIESSVRLCNSTMACEEAEAQCKEGNQASCNIFYDTYAGDCDSNSECTTYIENAECSATDSNISLNEGYLVDTTNCGNINDNNLNVKKCIIDNEDVSGNSYQATTEEFKQVVGNKYCEVYCKEDYHFTLPGIKEVNSGRYFSLQTSIEGAKTCYTSLIDKNNTFEADLEEKRQAVITAYNNWQLVYSARNNNTYTSTLVSGASHSAHSFNCESCSEEDEGCTNGLKCESKCPGDKADSYYDYTYTWSFDAFDPTQNNGAKLKSSQIENLSKKSSTSCSYVDEKLTCSHNTSGGSICLACSKSSKICYENCQSWNGGSIGSIYTEDDLKKEANTLNAAINDYINLLNEYNSCSGIGTVSYNTDFKSFTSDGWKMNYNYDPTIEFWYQESYMNDVINKELETVGNESKSEVSQSFCTGNTDDGYNTCNVGWKSSLDNNDTESQFICKKSGAGYTCGKENLIISKATYVKQEITASGNYITPTQFYTIYPTGAVVIAPEGKENEIENSTELTNLLPVGLGTTQGVYNYSLKVSNLGEYYNKNELGRLWGDSNSVVVNVLKDAEKNESCTKEGALTTINPSTGTSMNDANYICAYKVNCKDGECPVVCDPVCSHDGCPDNNCPVECENCIYTNNSTNVDYRPITPGNINPNDREMGVNWRWEDPIKTALELKAYVTTKEIEENGEEIYNIDYEDITGNADTGFAMQVKLNSNTINFIKSYNDKYEGTSGYANNTLECYDHVNSNDKKTYENIYCYSTFIDELIANDGGPDANGGSENVKIVGGTRYSKKADRETKTQISGYWTTWSEANNNSWTITTEKGIAYYKQNYKEIGIGPSWK